MTKQEKLKLFTKWYLKFPHTEESYKKNISDQRMLDFKFDDVMNLKYEVEVQEAVKNTVKANHLYDLVEIYSSMKQKALDGDVQSAKFIMDFCKSDLFKENESEISKLLANLKGE
ncbi:hypothetical protein [Cellulosilyticum lentocellum]|uniref:Uncharacterized protein n=1 Tax=Cellulosilyticum lentocellum (strain ATCC 49066 / DSM 5427 / NCIMB 11756 / RHM5) TaxID=642492 RepID=F2JGF8_CELLD|nr:hypothetical protein [Cellulosilyticum lentocellum]ADZ82913.1 hypothetical protein Clole_1184 [Cellulosilyticum lentocellum DSM 5427]